MSYSMQLARLAITVLILIILLFLGCRDQDRPADANHVVPANSTTSLATHKARQAAIEIQDAMARPAPLAGGNGAVYFYLHNAGDAVIRWMGADSPAARAVELHTTQNDNGVMRMRQIKEGVLIGPDESIQLTPGAMHLMLVDLAKALPEGDTVELTLHFEEADDLTVVVPVVGMDDLPAEGETEHDH